jgi:hypothetical protein
MELMRRANMMQLGWQCYLVDLLSIAWHRTATRRRIRILAFCHPRRPDNIALSVRYD